jgi:hypothetical protein
VTLQGLNWTWIGLEIALLPLLAMLVAYPFWRNASFIVGNIAGSMLICAAAIGLILREYVEVDKAVQACIDEGRVCWPHPSAETRFAIYACLGLFEVIVLFAISLSVERRMRNREYAVEWRR